MWLAIAVVLGTFTIGFLVLGIALRAIAELPSEED